jgi:hypothetical protein
MTDILPASPELTDLRNAVGGRSPGLPAWC